LIGLRHYKLFWRSGFPAPYHELSDNPKLEAEGTDEKIVGIVQEKIGQVKKVFGK